MMKFAVPFLAFALLAAGGTSGTVNASDWLTANRDYASTHYSPLTQTTAANAAKLRPVWGNAGSDVGAIGDMFALDKRTGRSL